MKRTQRINLERMRKQRMPGLLKPITLAVAGVALSGCDVNREEARVYSSIAECQSSIPEQARACEAAYQDALAESQRTAPKYANQADCEFEFGPENCVPVARPEEIGVAQSGAEQSWDSQSQDQSQAPVQHQAGHGLFMPMMAGFLMGRAMNANRPQAAPLYSSSSPRSPLYNKWTTPGGDVIGNRQQSQVRVNRDVFQPKPAVTRTVSRGGFGAMAAARSSASYGG